VQRAAFARVTYGYWRRLAQREAEIVLEARLCENVSINEDCTGTQYARRLVMMKSRWARFTGVAVGAIAVGLAWCAEAASADDQKLHVAATPADFAALASVKKSRSGKMAGGRQNPPTRSSGGILTAYWTMEPWWSCGSAIIGSMDRTSGRSP